MILHLASVRLVSSRLHTLQARQLRWYLNQFYNLLHVNVIDVIMLYTQAMVAKVNDLTTSCNLRCELESCRYRKIRYVCITFCKTNTPIRSRNVNVKNICRYDLLEIIMLGRLGFLLLV